MGLGGHAVYDAVDHTSMDALVEWSLIDARSRPARGGIDAMSSVGTT